jgi:hypothetical protein
MKINIKNITVEPLFKNYKKTVHLLPTENSEAVLVFQHNKSGLKKPSSFV